MGRPTRRGAWVSAVALPAALLGLHAAGASAATYYVRTDGGTAAQCSGLADAAYGGSGTGQACAWNHPFQALPPGGTPRISGGDTLVIGSGSYMMGVGAQGADACSTDAAWDCYMPPVPSGPSASQPTRILGAGASSGCPAPPELWGTERADMIVNLTGSSHVEIACLEVTDHSGCVEFHSAPGLACERDTPPYGTWSPLGLYAEDSSNVTLQDLDIHGLAATGVHAGRLTDWTVERVRIRGNGWAGWDGDILGDDGNSGTLRFEHWTVEWNGCAETYPGGQPTACWAQSAGGYGDGVGTGETGGHWIIEDSTFRYNTSDGLDLLYVRRAGSQIEIRRALAAGNAGNQLKTAGPTTIENVVVVGSCGYFEGKSFTYNVDNCRATGNAVSMDLNPGETATLTNSTLTSEGDCIVLGACGDPSGTCSGSATLRMRNDVFVGQTDFLQPFESTCLAWTEGYAASVFDIDYSILTGTKDQEGTTTCPGGSHDLCASPGITDSTLAGFDAHLTAGSPAIDSGTASGAPSDDYDGSLRDAQPDVGAYEYGATPPAQAPTVTQPTATSLTSTTATLGGNVTSDGGAAVSERGVVYAAAATNGDPALGGAGVTALPTSGTTGVFTVSVTGLSPGTEYAFKAYATNSAGTGYTSPAGTFTTAASGTAPTLSIDDPAVAEGDSGTTPLNFVVSLSAASTQTVSVAYATAPGTATAGEDYTPVAGSLSFAPGETSKTIGVSVLGDTAIENDETFFVDLSGPTNAALAKDRGTGTITDDDFPIASFTATPVLINRGESSTLAWNACSSCILALNGYPLTGTPIGTMRVTPTATATYTLEATVGGATVSRSVIVTVGDGTAGLGAPGVTAPASGQTVAVSAVTFTWTAVAGAGGYDLRVLDDAAGQTLFSGSLAGGSSTSAVLSLPNGAYTFAVRACAGGFTAAACGVYGSVRPFTVSLSTPSAGPTVTAPASGSTLTASTTTLSWTAVAGATSYEVLLKRLTDDSTALRITVFPPDQSTIFSLGSGRYRLTVRACLAACGPASTPSDFTVTLPEVPFAAPQLTSVSLSGTDLTLAWTAVANADLYRIQVVQPSSGPGGGALSVAARQVSETSVTLPVPQGQASILVAACNGDGCGSFGAPFPVDPAAGNPPLPNLGTPMKGTVVAGPVVNFSWNRVPGDDGSNTFYRLYVADLSRQTTALDVYTTDNFWAAYFKAEGARYDAQVIANPGCVSAGPGCTAAEAAGPASGFNVAGTSAVAPTLDTPGHQSSLTQGNLTLGWTPVAGATLYQYYVSGGGQNPAVTGVTTGLFVQVPLFAVDGLPTRYVGIVRACPAGATCAAGSDAGWGPWSDVGGPGVTSFTVTP